MTEEQRQKIEFVKDSGVGADYVRCPSCDKKRIAQGRIDDLCIPLNAEADMVCPNCGDVRLPYDCQGGTFDLEYPAVLHPLRAERAPQVAPQPEPKKPAASNCRDCVHRVRERVRRLVPLVVLRERFAETAIHGACEMFDARNMGSLEPSVQDCASYKQVSAEFVLSSAASGKWAQLDILADSELRFVLSPDASAADEEVCRSWAKALEFCRTHDDGMVVANAFVAKQVAPIAPSPFVKFPATASYIGEHVRRYVMMDGGKVLLERHERGSGTLYVCVESASPGLLLLLRDTFAGMMSALMATRAAAAEFCPQDPDYPDFWQPEIAVCVLSRTAAPVIFGALHGLPFPGEDSITPEGEHVDTTNRKTFTRDLAETFADPLAKEIALASLAHQEPAAKKG